MQFASAGDAQKVRDVLAKEPLLEVVTEPQTIVDAQATAANSRQSAGVRASGAQQQQQPFRFEAKMYLITRLGTIIGLTYDFQSKVVVRTRLSTYIKNILGAFPITQLQIVYGASHM